MLREPLELAVSECGPHCIVSDMMFPWVTSCGAKFGIPVIVFHGTCFFTLCAARCMRLYKPYDVVSTDSEAFVIPGLPDEIEMTRTQVGDYVMMKEDPESMSFFEASEESNLFDESYGVIVNTFYELEHDYVDYFRKVLGEKAWHVGPVSACKRNIKDKSKRSGKEKSSTTKHDCLTWLDTKKQNSVVYVCFGSLTSFPKSQLSEISKGLEASGQQFIWVVSAKSNKEEEEEEEWIPEGYEEKMEGRGMIIRGWTPQEKILEHEAVGAFVTHCGWNSTLESVCAGVPMVTWPNHADQFYNEKLVTNVLKIGIGLGAKKWSRLERDMIGWEAIERAVRKIMEGEEAEEMRKRAKELAHKATQAMQEGGSSLSSLDSLIHHLLLYLHH